MSALLRSTVILGINYLSILVVGMALAPFVAIAFSSEAHEVTSLLAALPHLGVLLVAFSGWVATFWLLAGQKNLNSLWLLLGLPPSLLGVYLGYALFTPKIDESFLILFLSAATAGSFPLLAFVILATSIRRDLFSLGKLDGIEGVRAVNSRRVAALFALFFSAVITIVCAVLAKSLMAKAVFSLLALGVLAALCLLVFYGFWRRKEIPSMRYVFPRWFHMILLGALSLLVALMVIVGGPNNYPLFVGLVTAHGALLLLNIFFYKQSVKILRSNAQRSESV